MEFAKQKMELFNQFLNLWSSNFFFRMFHTVTKKFKLIFETGNGNIQTGNGIIQTGNGII